MGLAGRTDADVWVGSFAVVPSDDLAITAAVSSYHSNVALLRRREDAIPTFGSALRIPCQHLVA